MMTCPAGLIAMSAFNVLADLQLLPIGLGLQ